jgi:hypothetical protein
MVQTAAAKPLQEAIVSALNDRANKLSCMACRPGVCQAGIACVER